MGKLNQLVRAVTALEEVTDVLLLLGALQRKDDAGHVGMAGLELLFTCLGLFQTGFVAVIEEYHMAV